MKADLETLLTPISADKPSGESLRYSGVYEAVEGARREDDPSLPQGVWKTELKRADWKEAARLCLDALETRSKDLQLAAWLLEAWIHLEGLPGAAAGLSLLGALCESFWDTVHPLPQEGDAEFRLAPLEWVAGRIPEAVRWIPITAPGGDEPKPCTYADLEGARHLERLSRTDPQAAQAAEAQGRISTDRFLVSVSLTPTAFYSVLEADARQALAALDGLAGLLARLCGNDAPSFQRLGDALFALQHFALRVLEERGEETAASPQGEAMDEMDLYPQADEEEGAFYGGSPIRSRAEAYRRLSEAADYLLRTEPHSPTPYLVRRAVAWGGMSLGELLQELVQGESDLRAIYTLLGMGGRPQ
ncbi:MAG TPA: type VI secretion system protein TssA [Thermoanaerobaculia bacterium]|jgi:type VI secretion system ImpA family protein|nr:type VI secretion system protein TssA [Thermoanaerobaculia bacterium]